MIELTGLDQVQFSNKDQVCAAIGFFDGVHLAHRKIIEICKERARERGGASLVFTFQNHPSSVLAPDRSVPLITPYPLKRELIGELGVDALAAVPFDKEFSRISAESFIADILCQRLCAREIVVGYNFHFGHKRGGSPKLLEECAPEKFDRVLTVQPLEAGGGPISSTRVRQAVAAGELDEARSLLGRPHRLHGRVVPGDGRGRTIGIPTANIDAGGQILPPPGVYGIRVLLDAAGNEWRWGVMNIGVAPTFKNRASLSAEAHLLDFSGDLYGSTLRADLLVRIREERKFPNAEALIETIHNDIASFRQWTGENRPKG